MPKPPFFTVITAPRKAGKSNLILNMLTRKDMLKGVWDSKDIFIISPNLDVNDDFQEIKANKISNFSNELLLEIIEKQKQLIKKFGQSKVKPLLIVLDDCLGESRFASMNSACEILATKGRHLLISAIIVSQSLRRISRTIRLNTDYFILFKYKNETEADAVLDEFFSKGDRKVAMQNIKNIFKEPYAFIVIDLATNDESMRYRKNFSEQINLLE